MSPGHAPGMIVIDMRKVVANRADHIAFHDLHVIHIVQQLESRRPNLLHEFRAPHRVITHVVFVIDLRIQQFHDHRHAKLLGQRCDTLQAGDTIREPLGI